MIMRNIIVAGVVHHNTLGMVRSLGLYGYKVDLVMVGRSGYLSKSRFVRRTRPLSLSSPPGVAA